jgi:hypothetical protein
MKNRASSNPAATTQSSAWLSRRDWRRALDIYLDGRMSRAEFERMKQRLTRVREGATARGPPQPQPRLRVLPGGFNPGSVLGRTILRLTANRLFGVRRLKNPRRAPFAVAMRGARPR